MTSRTASAAAMLTGFPANVPRYDKKSTIITSQLPVEKWHTYIDEPTLADAILDRVVHNSYRINLKGASMRKHRARAVSPPSA